MSVGPGWPWGLWGGFVWGSLGALGGEESEMLPSWFSWADAASELWVLSSGQST